MKGRPWNEHQILLWSGLPSPCPDQCLLFYRIVLKTYRIRSSVSIYLSYPTNTEFHKLSKLFTKYIKEKFWSWKWFCNFVLVCISRSANCNEKQIYQSIHKPICSLPCSGNAFLSSCLLTLSYDNVLEVTFLYFWALVFHRPGLLSQSLKL